jgi:hypothetical protein
MNPSVPSAFDQTPRVVALLSLAPFFISGLLRIVLYFQPGWMPEFHSPMYFLLLLISTLSFLFGIALGAARNFPRWVYSYPIFLSFSLNGLLLYANSFFGWEISFRNSFLLFLVLILLVLWLPGLRSFYKNISRDWTLLSYAFFGFAAFILFSIDREETPTLNFLVMLPSMIALFTAFVHLRARFATKRMIVLVVGTLLGWFLLLLAIFDGKYSPSSEFGLALAMFIFYGIAMAILLLSPMIVFRIRNILTKNQNENV